MGFASSPVPRVLERSGVRRLGRRVPSDLEVTRTLDSPGGWFQKLLCGQTSEDPWLSVVWVGAAAGTTLWPSMWNTGLHASPRLIPRD